MGKQDEIRKALADHARKYGPAQTMLATVESVDADEFTCSLKDDDELVYEGVRLRPVLDGNEALTIFPKVGTWALALRIEEGEDWMVISVGEADKSRIKIGETILEQTADGFLIEKDDDSLKDILTLHNEAMMQILVLYGNNPAFDKLQQALTKINNLLQ